MHRSHGMELEAQATRGQYCSLKYFSVFLRQFVLKLERKITSDGTGGIYFFFHHFFLCTTKQRGIPFFLSLDFCSKQSAKVKREHMNLPTKCYVLLSIPRAKPLSRYQIPTSIMMQTSFQSLVFLER